MVMFCRGRAVRVMMGEIAAAAEGRTSAQATGNEAGDVMSSAAPDAVPALPRDPGAGLTPKGRRTRARILEVSLRLFAESGSNATSLRAIAAEAGLSHAGVLRYFEDKDALLIAVLEHRDEMDFSGAFDESGQVRREVLAGDGPRTALRTL